MSERIQLETDDKTRRVISELHGAAVALNALKPNDKPLSQLPGFLMAVAIVEREIADMRAQMAGAVYRCAAKHGHDVANLRSIYTNIGKHGRPVVEIEPADLVQQAEAEEQP